MMLIRFFAVGIAVLLGTTSAAAAAPPDVEDAAIAAKCPAAQAWITRQQVSKASHSDAAVAQRDSKRSFSKPALRKELLQRVGEDQQRRHAWIATGMRSDGAEIKAMLSTDAVNLAWLKPLIARSGIPTVADVGEQGVAALWLLVQHADRDPVFQQQVLQAFKPRLADHEIPGSDYAMLTDRLLRNQGKPQRYGSQFTRDPAKPGALVLQPTEDPAHLDARRASVGLMPIADYHCVLDVVYAPAGAASASKPKS